jgi:hypothetical protein
VEQEGIEVFWQERTEAWEMQPDGSYVRTPGDWPDKARHPQDRIRKAINRH